MKVTGKKIVKLYQIIRFNGRALLGFEILFKLITTVLVIPFGLSLIQALLKVTGYHYLTMENLNRFLKHPLVIACLIIVLILIALYVMLDIGAILFVIDHSYVKQKVTVFQTFRFAWRNVERVFHRENLGLILYMVLILPFLSVGQAAIIGTTVTIPSFLVSMIEKHSLEIRFAMAGMTVVYFLVSRWFYVFHYYTLEQKDYDTAIRKSTILSKRHRLKDAFSLMIAEGVFYLMSFVLTTVGIILVLGLAKLFSELHILNYVYTSTVWSLLLVNMILVVAVGTPICFLVITLLYYLHKESNEEEIIHGAIVIKRVHDRYQRKVILTEWCVLFLTVCAMTFVVHNISTESVNPQVEFFRTMEVTAHRGASAFYPENTMSAFQGAVDFGADWIELDVQQSKDGKVFVMHDKSFKRTTGVNEYSWELTYDEIEQLDAGSFFSPNFKGERIPLLSEVIEFAKENNVRLNIEMKPSAQDQDLEKRIVDLIVEADYQGSCVVTSQIYSALEKVKEYNEEIMTVYVMSFAYGNVNRLTAADAFSMEAASITPRMVSKIHNAGKQVYAWTVNSRKKINRMIDLNVDNIITDRVALAQECIYESKTSTMIQKYVQFLRE